MVRRGEKITASALMLAFRAQQRLSGFPWAADHPRYHAPFGVRHLSGSLLQGGTLRGIGGQWLAANTRRRESLPGRGCP